MFTIYLHINPDVFVIARFLNNFLLLLGYIQSHRIVLSYEEK